MKPAGRRLVKTLSIAL